MSKLIEALNAVNICNVYTIVKKGHPFIYLSPANPRSVTCSAIMLALRGRQFKGAHWYDHGSLSFTYLNKAGRDEALRKALDKVKELFPDIKMVRGPWPFTWVPEEDLARAKKAAGV